MSPDVGVSRQAKAAETKRTRTRERILLALEELLNDESASKITFAAICKRAGCSTDPLYSAKHANLRSEIDARISMRLKEELAGSGGRKRRRSSSLTAELKIESLQTELAELQIRHKAALVALNVLAQVVQKVSSKGPEFHTVLHLLDGGSSD